MSTNPDDLIQERPTGPVNRDPKVLDYLLRAHGYSGLDALAPPAARPDGVEASPTMGKLAGALAKAQGAFESIAKTRTVQVRSDKGSYSFDYAPLDEVLRAVRPHLAANGLSFTQLISGDGQRKLTTVLLHESGEWMSTSTLLPVSGNRAQELGSTITYMRRYTLLSLLGVVADEDDDGNAGDGNGRDARDRDPPKGRQSQTNGGNSSTPSQGGSKQTPPSPANGGPSSNGSPVEPAKAERLWLLLTAPARMDADPRGLGLAPSAAFDWLRDHFGRGASTPLAVAKVLSAEQVDTGAILAVAASVGAEQYATKRAELAKAGRCTPGKAVAA